MLAAVLHAPGDLRIETDYVPPFKPGEALVRVKYVGVCGSDLDRVMKTGTYVFPLVPGHEFSGEILSMPEGTKSSFKPGDRVVAAPIIPCRGCDACEKGQYGLCDSYDYVGSRRNGAMAEQVYVPVENLLPLPDSVSFQEGAMIEPASVTLHGALNARITAGDRVCVLGCGTIGLFAVQFAKIMGANLVIASDIEPAKLELARELGADVLVNPLSDDLQAVVAAHTDGRGCDLVVETAGTPQTQQVMPIYAKNRGRILLLGTAHKDVVLSPRIYERIVRKELTLLGSWNSFSTPFPGIEWRACLDYVAAGRLNLKDMISHTVPLADAPSIIGAMSRRELLFTKVLLEL